MAKERFKLIPFVALFLYKDKKVLLMRRFNTGLNDGMYGGAGGGIESAEPATQAIIREAYEELGIQLKKENLKIVHIVHAYNKQGQEFINFFVETTEWEGNPKIMEPNKCDDIAWFDVDNLPSNILPLHKHVLEMIKKNIFYSEYGWQ
jgi:8-oxo-dGTP diphosphatase